MQAYRDRLGQFWQGNAVGGDAGEVEAALLRAPQGVKGADQAFAESFWLYPMRRSQRKSHVDQR
jgi:hypothetical protein